jgi:HAD superfamily hydrolase (TIGR01450 family)
MQTVALSPLLDGYEQLLLDLDGCVWVGEQATAGAAEAIAQLRAAGRRVAFVTNNAHHGGEDFVRKLWGLGIQASLREVVTPGGALQHVLAERHPGGGAVVIGSAAVHKHVRDAGLRVLNGSPAVVSADVVVVSGHDNFDYSELRDAARAVMAGAMLLASDRDPSFPLADGPAPGTGAVLAAVETATGRVGEAVGKPDPQLFMTALDRLGAGRTLVVGDRLDADLAGAAAAGLDCAIVLTGATGREQAEAASDPRPIAIADSLADLINA